MSTPSQPLCTVCQQQPTRQLTTSCGHAFCGPCIGSIVWSNATRGVSSTCPVCRQTVKSVCSAASADNAYWATIRVGRVHCKLDVNAPKETCALRLSSILGVPKERLKLIAKGNMLRGEAEVHQAAQKGIQLLLMASRPEATTLRRTTYRWLECLCALLWGRVASLLRAACGLHVVQALRSFFVSLVYPPQPTDKKKKPADHAHAD